MDDRMLDAIRQYMSSRGMTNRSDVVRLALNKWLEHEGFLRFVDTPIPGGARKSQEEAETKPNGMPEMLSDDQASRIPHVVRSDDLPW